MVSNIDRSDLLRQAFHFIPGRKLEFEIAGNAGSAKVKWEALTDSFNNTYLSCSESGSTALFRYDGNLLYFTHFEGDKNSLLYYFFLSVFKLQMGYYQDLELRDRFPLNLLFRFPLLSLQDFTAPVWKFLSAEFTLKYVSVDSEISPSEIVLESSARSRILEFETDRLDFILHIKEEGIHQFEIRNGKTEIVARCVAC